MDIGQYLQQNYPRCKSVTPITVNGEVKGYYAKSNSDQIYIPASALNSSSVGMVSYLPGAGGMGNDAAMLRERIQNNPPDYIISIAAECSDHNNALATGYSMAKGMGINVTNNVTVCFSASGFKGFERTNSFVAQHPEVKSTIVACEPYGGDHIYSTRKEDITGLKNAGTKVIYVTPKKGFHINAGDAVKVLSSQGVDTYWLQTNYKGQSGSVHIATNRDVITSGMLDYLLGYSKDFNHEPGGDKYSPGWQLIGFDKSTGEAVAVADYATLLQNGVGMVEVPDLEKLKKVDSFEIKTTASPVQKKYASLKTGTNTEIKSKDGSPISSEYTYVSTKMNELKNQIKQSSFLSGFSNMGFRSSSGIPGCIMGYLNTYFDVIGSLLNSLSLEADAVISYGQAMVDMDADLKSGASQVGTVYEMDQSAKMIKPGGLEAFEEKPAEQNPKTGAENGTDTSSGTNTDTSSGGTYTYSGGDYSGGSYSGGSYSGGSSSGGSSSGGSSSSTPTPTPTPTQTDAITPTEAPTTTPTPTPTETPTTPEQTQIVQQEETPPTTQPDYVYTEPEDGGYYYEGEPSTPGEIPVEEMPTELPTEEELPTITPEVTEEMDIPLPTEQIPTTPSISKIPVSETPINATPGKKKSPVLPIIAGLSVATAAGIGAKAYIDHKTNNSTSEEDIEDYDYDDEERMDFSYNENESVEDYSARMSDELADVQ